MTKYNAKKTVIDGITFDSKSEGEYYALLLEKQRDGAIQSFELQPRYELQPSFVKNGKMFRKIDYVADFKVIHLDGTIEIIDIKGMFTETFSLKLKMFEKCYPDYSLTLLKYVKKFGGFITVDEWKRLKKEEKKK